MSRAASGDIVIGAMPMPAETSETARLRLVSNQPVTQAIIGAKIAAMPQPTIRPKTNWNCTSDVAKLASARLPVSSTEPVSTTGRAPMRSERLPHAMLANDIARGTRASSRWRCR